MNNKLLYIVIFLLLAIIAGGAYFLFARSNSLQESATPDQIQPESGLPQGGPTESSYSEQPSQAKFDEYFTKASLGKLPIDEEFNPFKVTPTNIFTVNDQFCTSLEIKKTVVSGSLGVALYDTVKKDYFQPKVDFPVELKKGGSVGCQGMDYPVGKYEYKIYVDNVLAIVLPFEVK